MLCVAFFKYFSSEIYGIEMYGYEDNLQWHENVNKFSAPAKILPWYFETKNKFALNAKMVNFMFNLKQWCHV